MRPIRQGDRGPAVEDVQKTTAVPRLRHRARRGVDGVFLGATLAAVRSFQTAHALAEDGIVGPRDVVRARRRDLHASATGCSTCGCRTSTAATSASCRAR